MAVCLYTCKRYDDEEIIKYTNKYWEGKENNAVVMHRYVGKPQDISTQQFKLPKLVLV